MHAQNDEGPAVARKLIDSSTSMRLDGVRRSRSSMKITMPGLLRQRSARPAASNSLANLSRKPSCALKSTTLAFFRKGRHQLGWFEIEGAVGLEHHDRRGHDASPEKVFQPLSRVLHLPIGDAADARSKASGDQFLHQGEIQQPGERADEREHDQQRRSGGLRRSRY